MTNYIQPLLYNVVCRLYKKRVDNNIFPYVAIEKDIQSELSNIATEALSEMVADGILQCHENINRIKMYAPSKVDLIPFNDI